MILLYTNHKTVNSNNDDRWPHVYVVEENIYAKFKKNNLSTRMPKGRFVVDQGKREGFGIGNLVSKSNTPVNKWL